MLPWFKFMPCFDRVRPHPRFRPCLRGSVCRSSRPTRSSVRVLRDEVIGREDRQAMHDGLADEHAVERVAMEAGSRERGAPTPRRWAGGDAVRLAHVAHEAVGRVGQRQAAEAVLDGNLPGGRGAQVHLVVRRLKEVAGARESAGASATIQRNVQVSSSSFTSAAPAAGWANRLRVHPATRAGRPERGPGRGVASKPPSTSSGSASKNDGGTANRPRAEADGPRGGAGGLHRVQFDHGAVALADQHPFALRGHVQVLGQLGLGFEDVDYNHGHIVDHLLCAVKRIRTRGRPLESPGAAGLLDPRRRPQ